MRQGRVDFRAVWAGCARWVALVCLCLPLIAAGKAQAPRIATPDWGIAQNLIAMGVPPVGVGQAELYKQWVGYPSLPASVHDLGLRSQPNLELLSQLAPDRILITGFYTSLERSLSRIAPVSVVDVYSTPGNVWDKTVSAVKRLGDIAHRPDAARALIRRTRKDIQRAAARLPAHAGPLLVLQFVDAQHVIVFGRGSLIAATMKRMGLVNAWQGNTTRWGSATVPLSRLASIETGRVVVMGPVPVGVAGQLASSRLWHSLPVVHNAPVAYMPGVWSFGGLPSASHFARLVVEALRRAPKHGPGWPQAWPDP